MAPVAVLAALSRAAAAQAPGDAPAAVGAVGWLFLLFALAALAVAIVLLRRLQKVRADLTRTEAERAGLQAREAALPLARIRWRSGGTFALEEKAAGLLNGRPDNIEALLALLAEPDRAAIGAGLAKLDRDGTAFTGAAKCTATGRTIKLSAAAAADGERMLCLDDVEDLLQQALAPYEQGRAELGQLSALLDRLPYPVWRRDAGMTVTYCNRAHARLFGGTPADVIAKGREISSAAKALARRAQKLSLAQSESQQLVVDGHRRLYDFHEVPLEDGSLVGYALDQTALEESHAELVRHIAAHDDVLQSLGNGIVIFGPDRRVKFFNAAYRDQFSLDANFLRGEPTIDQVLEALRERRQIAEQADFRSFKQEFIRHVMTLIEPFEDLMHTPGGATFRMVATPHPFGGVTLTFEDVTDKLTLERNYNTLIAVQKETIDNLYEGIAVFGSDGRLKIHNPAYAKLWNLGDEDLEGEPHVTKIVDLVRPYFEGPYDWAEIRQRIVSDAVERMPRSLRLERKDGTIIDIAGIPLPDGGKLFKYADVTDSINMERALRDRNEALIAADRLKSEFIANVSYEFRTPLNVIIGYAELLIRQYFGALNQRQAEYAASILDAAQGLLLMVGDVIDVAAIEAGYIRLDIAEIRLQPVLESVMRLYQQRAHSREIELKVDDVAEGLTLKADEQRLKQALANLISNAVGSGSVGSRVEITARNEGDHVAISVKQTGLQGVIGGEATDFGVTSVARASLGRGTTRGLGMALVKTLIELHGGSMETRSGPGFRMVVCRLPLEAVSRPPVAVGG
ncbi:PAS-domain containing protein [Dongia sedimenti]|uniref:histidine kinase n=1 Tax=Dongia sedimenti TaxID=3064282 RepID=A0ABU0YMM3_9PROT|nr:PAS-domain containing protein [Rhodospirillaceae bacterium R-7]